MRLRVWKGVSKKLKTIEIIGTRGYPSYYGGFETAVRRIAPYFADQGWGVTVYSRPGAVKEEDPSRDRRIKSRVTWGMEEKSLSTLSFGLTSCLTAARTKPDVALVMNVANGFFLPLLKWRGVKTIVNVDGIEWQREKWGRIAKAVFRIGARFTARFADELVYDSLEIERFWKENFGRTGSFIPYGGDSSEPLPFKETAFDAGSYVLLVARFVPENTVFEFIEAAKTISSEHPVVLVGSSGYGGELDDAAARMAETHANIHLLGHISDDERLHSLWQHAGAYFHGHSVGGTNPTLVQAMALGVPVVARDTVYNREVLGECGVFAQPNADSIAKEVLALMKDASKREELSKQLSARANAEYTWKKVASAYDSLAQRLAAGDSAKDAS